MNYRRIDSGGADRLYTEAIATNAVVDDGYVIIFSCNAAKTKTLYIFLGKQIRAEAVHLSGASSWREHAAGVPASTSSAFFAVIQAITVGAKRNAMNGAVAATPGGPRRIDLCAAEGCTDALGSVISVKFRSASRSRIIDPETKVPAVEPPGFQPKPRCASKQ
jgi:hypothetical protein